MGEEEPGPHLLAQASQVLVGPGGPDLPVGAGLPALPESLPEALAAIDGIAADLDIATNNKGKRLL